MSARVKTVSKAKALAVYKRFQEKYYHRDISDSSLVFDWRNGHPAIVWEGGDAPDDWAIDWNEDVKGTICEPYYSFVLVIYPDWNK